MDSAKAAAEKASAAAKAAAAAAAEVAANAKATAENLDLDEARDSLTEKIPVAGAASEILARADALYDRTPVKSFLDEHPGMVPLIAIAALSILLACCGIIACWPRINGYFPLHDPPSLKPNSKELLDKERKKQLRESETPKLKTAGGGAFCPCFSGFFGGISAFIGGFFGSQATSQRAAWDTKANPMKDRERERNEARAKTAAATAQAKAMEVQHRNSLRAAQGTMTPAQLLMLQQQQEADLEAQREMIARMALAQAMVEKAFRQARHEAAQRVNEYRKAQRAREAARDADLEEGVLGGLHLQIKAAIPFYPNLSPPNEIATNRKVRVPSPSKAEPHLESQHYDYAAQILAMPLGSPHLTPGSKSPYAGRTPLAYQPEAASPNATLAAAAAAAAATPASADASPSTVGKMLNRGKAMAAYISPRLGSPARLSSAAKKIKAQEPKAVPNTAPMAVPNTAPKAVPNTAPMAVPNTAPMAVPKEDAQMVALNMAPNAASEPSAAHTPATTPAAAAADPDNFLERERQRVAAAMSAAAAADPDNFLERERQRVAAAMSAPGKRGGIIGTVVKKS